MFSFMMKKSETLDFDEEARQLWARLNIDPTSITPGPYNHLDPVWRHPRTGATIFVGNRTAASTLEILRSNGITHVVNCTSGSSKIPNFHEGKLKYYEFPVTYWSQFVNELDQSVLTFTSPLFEFIESALERGSSVLVHCLAGAHRAGTTGVLCIMNYTGLDTKSAITTAKRCRKIIDPIGMLPEFLKRFERAKLNASRVLPGAAPTRALTIEENSPEVSASCKYVDGSEL
jgi:protein tyrosine phosphatase